MARKHGDNAIAGPVYSDIGATYMGMKQYPAALNCHQQNLAISREYDNKEGMAKAYSSMGDVRNKMKEYVEALDCHHIALEIFQEIEDHAGEGRQYAKVGSIRHTRGLHSSAARPETN